MDGGRLIVAVPVSGSDWRGDRNLEARLKRERNGGR
jgi:hypothetical protein